MNFIHVDLYENPLEIRSMGLGVAIETPLLREWGLRTPEWTFIVGADGLVAGRFEAFAPEGGARGGTDRAAGRGVTRRLPPILGS